MKPWMIVAVLAVLLVMAGVGGYNSFQGLDEGVKASWSEVVNQYKRRADLVPNLVNTVKGYAAHEEQVLTEVTNARAKVGQVNISPETLNDPQAFAAFEKSQGALSSALSRLMVVAENYPQLKADALFRDLQAQLEGTENRITVARGRYIAAVQAYNVAVRTFPNSIVAALTGNHPKPNFTVENEKEIENAPPVNFGVPAPVKP